MKRKQQTIDLKVSSNSVYPSSVNLGICFHTEMIYVIIDVKKRIEYPITSRQLNNKPHCSAYPLSLYVNAPRYRSSMHCWHPVKVEIYWIISGQKTHIDVVVDV